MSDQHHDRDHDPMRRTVLAALAGLPLLGASTADAQAPARTGTSRTLVAYLSRTGNTRVIAGLLQRGLKADLFEIRTATPYPEDYLETVEQAKQEREAGVEPALAERVPDLSGYGQVFLGFPIWGGSVPAPVRSFLTSHSMAGKTLTPFITHGGYGIGDSRTVLAEHAPGARLREAFVMEADQERRTMNAVNDWLKGAAQG